MISKKIQISMPFLVFLIIGFSSLIALMGISYLFHSRLLFSTSVVDNLHEFKLQRHAMHLSAYVNHFLERGLSECFSGPWNKFDVKKMLESKPYIKALWFADNTNKRLHVMNGSHEAVVEIVSNTDFRKLLLNAERSLKNSNKEPDYSIFESGSEFVPISQNMIKSFQGDEFIWAETDFFANPAIARGVLFDKEILFEKVIGKFLCMLCDPSWIKLELLDSSGKTALFADRHKTYKKMPEFSANVMEPLNLNGFLENFKLRIYFRRDYSLQSEIISAPWLLKNAPLILALLVLLLSLSIVYFYYISKRSDDSLSLQNDWIANLSHTLIGPLHSLGILSEAFDRAKPETKSEISRLIKMEIEIMDKACRQFMRLSRAGKNNIELTLQDVSLMPIVKSIHERLCFRYPHFEKEDIIIKGADNLTAIGDSVAITDIIETVFDNALKYSPKGTAVCIKLESLDGEIHIHFVDQGLGIPVDELPRIGEAFFRSSSKDTDGIVGTGIGIYLAKKLCLRMKGRLEITSAGSGKGCHATVILPEAKS